MASLHSLKPRLQHLLRPAAGRLAGRGVTANAVTLSALALSAGYGAVLAATHGHSAALLGLPAVMLVRLGLNAIDGMVAREHGQASVEGAYLNELGDVVSDAALFLPFALILPCGALVVLTVMAGALAEFAGVLAQTQTGVRRYDGPFGKGDRAALFGLVAIAQAFVPLAPAVVTTVFGLALAASVLTIVNRLRGSHAHA